MLCSVKKITQHGDLWSRNFTGWRGLVFVLNNSVILVPGHITHLCLPSKSINFTDDGWWVVKGHIVNMTASMYLRSLCIWHIKCTRSVHGIVISLNYTDNHKLTQALNLCFHVWNEFENFKIGPYICMVQYVYYDWEHNNWFSEILF